MSIIDKLCGFLCGGDKKMAVIDRVLLGEALVGDGNEVAHIDLMMGPRGSAAESAFCNALTITRMVSALCWLLWHQTWPVSQIPFFLTRSP